MTLSCKHPPESSEVVSMGLGNRFTVLVRETRLLVALIELSINQTQR